MDKAKIAEKINLKILIAGATGSVGTAAIQIARHHKADITVVCSTEGRKLVSELGVNRIVLYDKNDFINKPKSLIYALML